MADIKISALPSAAVVNPADIVVLNQGGTTKTATQSLVVAGLATTGQLSGLASTSQLSGFATTTQLSAYVPKTGTTMEGRLIMAATTDQAKANIGGALSGVAAPLTSIAGDVWVSNQSRLTFSPTTGTAVTLAGLSQANTFNQAQTIGVGGAVTALSVLNNGTGRAATFGAASASTAVSILQTGAGDALRVEDETSPDATPFVISGTGRVGIGVAPDAVTALSVDSGGIKFADGSFLTTAVVALNTAQIAAITPTQIGAVSTADVISIGKGGTGSTTAVSALTALGAMSATQLAGGDLSGSLPNPVVAKIQGQAVSAVVPGSGQVLTWDGASWIATAPATGGSGGGGVLFYMNYGTAPDAPAPIAAKELGRTAEIAQSTITSGTLPTGVWTPIAGFVSDTLDPNLEFLPGGLFDFNVWCRSNANINAPTSLRVVVNKWDGTTSTPIATSGNAIVTSNGTSAQTAISLVIPQTDVTPADRLYIVLEAEPAATGHNITIDFGDSTPSHVHTTIPSVGGTGVVKVINGVPQNPASLIIDSDVSTSSPLALNKIQMGQVSVATGTGLTGGGDLSASRTLSIAALSPDPNGTYGSTSQIPSLTVNNLGQVTAVATLSFQPPNIQTFNIIGANTYTKPAGARVVRVQIWSGGGGGGSGRKGLAGTVRCGGGGGGSGQVADFWFDASAIGATETVTIGGGGAGAPSTTTNSTNGSNGSAGGTTSFGSHVVLLGGASGSAGTAAQGASGGGGHGGNTGAAASTTGSTGTNGVPSGTGSTCAANASGSGAAGAGITVGNVNSAGGSGGRVILLNLVGGAAGSPGPTAAASAGGNGPSMASLPLTGGPVGGAGGGSGASSVTGDSGYGGDGGFPGGGGGGGAAAVDGVGNSGAGGTGGRGAAIITTYF